MRVPVIPSAAIGIVLATVSALLQTPAQPRRQVDAVSFVPAGAALVLQAKDLSTIVADWNRSSEKAKWLASDNYSAFSRSRLFLRLTEAYGEFAAAAGAPVDMTLVYLATHQHRLGTYGNIEIVDPDGVTRSKVYENEDWQHPYSYWPAPPIRLAQNQKMRITCTWHNTDDHDVVFGPKTTDEMCFILGFYYRDDGDTTPVTGHGCIPAKRGLLCPLAPVVTE